MPVTVPPTIVPPLRYHEPVAGPSGNVAPVFDITPVMEIVVVPVCCTARACAVVNVPPMLTVEPEVVIVPAPVLLQAPPRVNVPLVDVTPPAFEFDHAPLPPIDSDPPDVVSVLLLLPVPLLLNVTVLPLPALMLPLLLHAPDDVRLSTLPLPVALIVPVFVHATRFTVKVPPPSLVIVPLLMTFELPEFA